METFGYIASLNGTNFGRCARGDPDSDGSSASHWAVEASDSCDTNYALGSVLNHVLLHQTVIGQEAIAQMDGR
jgi:tryptophan synthase beta chain